MRLSRRITRKLERGNIANAGEAPINLVPMIDILTVLVLYLLVGSVYEHLSILQLNLPSSAATATPPDKPQLQLTLTIRKDSLEVADFTGAVRKLPRTAEGYGLETLGQLLEAIKRTKPQEDSVVLLLEPDISYDTLVQIMDTVRLFPAASPEAPRKEEMFPVISIGDAQKESAGS